MSKYNSLTLQYSKKTKEISKQTKEMIEKLKKMELAFKLITNQPIFMRRCF